MEALTISAANLDTIEKNLGAVANELTGVISNVSSVNNQVNKVEAQVADLNDEVKNLVKEIKETTIITNARQSIMYNNEQIEKKYGYYDKVRRTTISLLDAIENSNIRIQSLINLNQELLLNNPNYWLTNALSCLTSWILNDKASSDKELNNALKKDEKKTSLFFCLINLKLGRTSTSLNWLNKYLSSQSPLRLDKDFVTILDLVATGTFGNNAKNVVLNKISTWFEKLNSNADIQNKQIDFWLDYITSLEETNIKMPYLETATPDINILKENLAITSSYVNVLGSLEKITYSDSSNKTIDEILNNIIYDYEANEQEYQKDNLRNNLIIACNGDREEADHLFKKQEEIYNENTDLISLLSNIVLYKEQYKISNETQKIALTYIKNYIIKAYEERNGKINLGEFNIQINSFVTKTKDGKNIEETNRELDNHLNTIFNSEDKDLIVILLIVNILGIIGIFITLNNKVLSTILIIIIILGNVLLFLELSKRSQLRNREKEKLRKTISDSIERVYAEVIDYRNMMDDDHLHYEELLAFLNDIETENYIKSNEERNIRIGE